MNFDLEADRRNGYRPGIAVALVTGAGMPYREVLLGRRAGSWTEMVRTWNGNAEQDSAWKFGWGLPQGGIEPGESCEEAIRREIAEELGPEWAEQIMGTPQFLFRDQSSFPFEKDGKRWRGKTLYCFAVHFKGPPDYAIDMMYGLRQDEDNTVNGYEFEGDVRFWKPAEALSLIRKSHRGFKAAQLVRIVEASTPAKNGSLGTATCSIGRGHLRMPRFCYFKRTWVRLE